MAKAGINPKKISIPSGFVERLEIGQKPIMYLCGLDNGERLRTEQDARIIAKAIEQLLGEERGLLLVDLTRLRYNVPKEVRAYLVDEVLPLVDASAVLVGTGISKIMGNIILSFHRKVMPRRLFTDKNEAINWLNTI